MRNRKGHSESRRDASEDFSDADQVTLHGDATSVRYTVRSDVMKKMSLLKINSALIRHRTDW
jgi:hypothetical protein